MLPEDFSEQIFLKQLEQELGELSTSMVIRWIAILDLMKPNEERALVVVTSPGMEEWEYDGMFLNAPYPWAKAEEEVDVEEEDEG